MINRKRKLRRISIEDYQNKEKNLNRATREDKEILNNEKHQSTQEYLEGLKLTKTIDYDLWKAISN